MPKLLAVLAATPLVACAQTPPTPPAATTTTGPVVQALLIGITQYNRKDGLAPLDGPQNDVKLMHEVLTKRFAVPASNIRVVLNPTHSVIEQEFAALRQRVRPHDYVYIHYSGHGSTAPDPSEPRGDQTWVPHGARAHKLEGKDDWDVLDKEINVWMAPLYGLTEDVVFVSDSCHSGTVSRGDRRGVRDADPVAAPHPLLGKLPVVAQPTSGVRIGAARDFETAVELDHRNGSACNDQERSQCYGVFTWHWAQALNESRPGEAWGDVFNRANARITTQPYLYQRPQIEGRADRAVFDGRFAALTTTVAVTEVSAQGATLGAGALAGVSVGSIYRSIVPQDATPATLRVKRVDGLTSVAEVQAGSVQRADLVTEATHAYVAPPIRIYLGGPAAPTDTERLTRVREAITQALPSTLAGFKLVSDPANADWLLQIARPPANTNTPAPGKARRLPDHPKCAPQCPPPQLWVVSRQGLLMDEHMRFDLASPDKELPRLLDDLHKFAWAQEVRRLAARGNGSPLRLLVTIWRPPPGDQRKCAEGAAAGSGWASFGPYPIEAVKAPPRLNDCLAFEIENRSSDHTWYGYVVAIGPSLGINSALPPPDLGSDEARVSPGTKISSTKARLYRLNEIGVESVLLLASDGPVPAQALQQSGVRAASQSQLDALLAVAANRRGELESGGEWGATRVDFAIGAP